jgi:hypothetical protein
MIGRGSADRWDTALPSLDGCLANFRSAPIQQKSGDNSREGSVDYRHAFNITIE